jgi:chromate transporter
VDPWVLGLSGCAVVAIFGLKIGMIPTLSGCSFAGMALYLTGVIS